MTWELYLAYVAAAWAVLLLPGPTVMLVVGYGLSSDRRGAMATVAGVGLGDLTSVTLSLAGLGAIMAASASLFTALKLVGACYLVWLGIKMFRSNPDLEAQSGPNGTSNSTKLRRAWMVTALNPKSIAFYVAFLPQFVSPETPLVPQLVLLGGTWVVMAVGNASMYALLAGSLGQRAKSPVFQKVVARVGGSVLVGAGVMTALVRR